MMNSKSLSFPAIRRGISRLNSYYVYIMGSKTGTLYVGVTNDLRKRILEHKSKLIPGFSSKYNINELLYHSEFSSINQAIEVVEKMLKGWSRIKKVELIKTINPTFKDLAEELNLEILHLTVLDDKGDN